MNPLSKLVEAALFASARPLTVEELLTLDPQAGAASVRAALAELRDAFAAGDHGVELIEIAQGWQFDGYHGQPVIEIFAEHSLPDCFF